MALAETGIRLPVSSVSDTKTKSYATLEQVSDPEKISSDIKYDRHTDDDLLFAAFHELFHNDTGAGIKDHHYAYHKLTWKGVIKDSENNVIRHTETVALDHLNPKKTVENPDSYAYVAIVWKDCMENKKNLPIRSTLTKSQVAPVEMENIVNDPDIKIIYDRLKSQKD